MGNKTSELLELERSLSFKNFCHDDGLNIALQILDKVKNDKLKDVAIRVSYKRVTVFQYLMNKKKEEIWLRRKQNTVYDSGHSSLYTMIQHIEKQTYKSFENNEDYVLCGGGFPIIEDDQTVGAICVSGLKHDEDHQIIVDVLTNYLKENE